MLVLALSYNKHPEPNDKNQSQLNLNSHCAAIALHTGIRQYASERRTMALDTNERNGLQEIIDNTIAQMREKAGIALDLDEINPAEFCRRTGLSRTKARKIKADGFKVLPSH